MADATTPESFGGPDPVVEVDVRAFLAGDHADAIGDPVDGLASDASDDPVAGPADLVAEPVVTSPGATADLAELERIELELAEVETALARLDDGTYGSCQVCQGPIADELLAAQPLARTCSAHL